MRAVLTAIIVLLAFTATAYSQTVIHQTIPGTMVRDWSAPSFIVERDNNINAFIATGGGYRPPMFDFNQAQQNSLINRNLEIQNQLLQQQLEELRRR